MLPVRGDWDLPVGPLTGQVDTDAGHNGRGVLQAEGGQVQADVTGRENKKPSTPTPELQIHAGHGGEMWPLRTSPEGPSGTASSILLQHSGGFATASLVRAWFATGNLGSPPPVFLFVVFRKVNLGAPLRGKATGDLPAPPGL